MLKKAYNKGFEQALKEANIKFIPELAELSLRGAKSALPELATPPGKLWSYSKGLFETPMDEAKLNVIRKALRSYWLRTLPGPGGASMYRADPEDIVFANTILKGRP